MVKSVIYLLQLKNVDLISNVDIYTGFETHTLFKRICVYHRDKSDDDQKLFVYQLK